MKKAQNTRKLTNANSSENNDKKNTDYDLNDMISGLDLDSLDIKVSEGGIPEILKATAFSARAIATLSAVKGGDELAKQILNNVMGAVMQQQNHAIKLDIEMLELEKSKIDIKRKHQEGMERRFKEEEARLKFHDKSSLALVCIAILSALITVYWQANPLATAAVAGIPIMSVFVDILQKKRTNSTSGSKE